MPAQDRPVAVIDDGPLDDVAAQELDLVPVARDPLEGFVQVLLLARFLEQVQQPLRQFLAGVDVPLQRFDAQVIERFARDKGVPEVDETILDAARDFFGM